MKRISILLILLALTASVFANGVRENAPDSIDPGFGRINGESVTLSGTLDVTAAEVVLLTDEGEFSLSAPRARLLDLESFNNLYATITGTMSECDDCEDLYDGHIFVESAEIDGDVYTLDVVGGQGRFMADDERGFRNAPVQENNRLNSERQMPGGMRDTRNTRSSQDDRMMQNNRSGSVFGGRGSI